MNNVFWDKMSKQIICQTFIAKKNTCTGFHQLKTRQMFATIRYKTHFNNCSKTYWYGFLRTKKNFCLRSEELWNFVVKNILVTCELHKSLKRNKLVSCLWIFPNNLSEDEDIDATFEFLGKHLVKRMDVKKNPMHLIDLA